MSAPKLSKSKARQNVYADIWGYLEELGAEEVRHYVSGFPREIDYNLVQYGEMRVYYDEIRDMYANAGYNRVTEVYKRASRNAERGDYKVSDSELWDMYKRDVRNVVNEFLERN